MRHAALFVVATSWFLAGVTVADDWPQWMGPRRDSVWRETGLVERFPEDGLHVKWRVPVELGYAGPAVANGKVFLLDYVRDSGPITNNPGGRDKLKGKERVLCLDARTGRTLWKHEYEVCLCSVLSFRAQVYTDGRRPAGLHIGYRGRPAVPERGGWQGDLEQGFHAGVRRQNAKTGALQHTRLSTTIFCTVLSAVKGAWRWPLTNETAVKSGERCRPANRDTVRRR